MLYIHVACSGNAPRAETVGTFAVYFFRWVDSVVIQRPRTHLAERRESLNSPHTPPTASIDHGAPWRHGQTRGHNDYITMQHISPFFFHQVWFHGAAAAQLPLPRWHGVNVEMFVLLAFRFDESL